MRHVILSIVAIAAVGCGPSHDAHPETKVRIAIHRDPIAFLPVRAAQALGFFRSEGVNVELSELGAGAKAIEAMIGGSVDVAAGALSDVIALDATGRRVRAFVVLYDRPTVALAVAPALSGSVRTVADLKGRIVGVSAPGSATHQLLNFLLMKNGLSPDDVSTVSVGMTSTSIAALEHTQVAAAVLVASAATVFERRHPATPFLADTRTAAGAVKVFGSDVFPSLSLLAPDDWLANHRDVALALARAVVRGLQWVREQPPAKVRELLPDEARMATDDDLAAIRESQQALSRDGRVAPGAAELVERFVAVSDARVRASHLDPASTYTNEFIGSK